MTRAIAPVARLRTKMSVVSLVSPGTRFEAALRNATLVPSGLKQGVSDAQFPWTPPADVLIRVIAPVTRSLTNTSSTPLVSLGTRFDAVLLKTTFVPSWLMAEDPLS